MIRNPLRITDHRLWLWTGALTVAGLISTMTSSRASVLDLHVFLLAGRVAGTPALVHPADPMLTFPYLPAAAFPFALLDHVPWPMSFWINSLVMLACAVAAGVVAARTFGLVPLTGIAFTLAWFPLMDAIYIGQNTALGVVCAMLTIAGMARGAVVLTAVPLGVLMYKPTYALPLIAVLLFRGRARELALAAALAAIWYAASVVATGGDWQWPLASVHMIERYASGDFAFNASKTISIPGLLTRMGLPAAAIFAVSAIVAGVCIPLLRRVDALEAGCSATLIGLALSPHAWGYDAALALPMLFIATTRVHEPVRTPLVCACYLTAPVVLVSAMLRFDPLAVTVIGGMLAWMAMRRSAFGLIGPGPRRRRTAVREAFPEPDPHPAPVGSGSPSTR